MKRYNPDVEWTYNTETGPRHVGKMRAAKNGGWVSHRAATAALAAQRARLALLLQDVLKSGGVDIDGDWIDSIRGELRARIVTELDASNERLQ